MTRYDITSSKRCLMEDYPFNSAQTGKKNARGDCRGYRMCKAGSGPDTFKFAPGFFAAHFHGSAFIGRITVVIPLNCSLL